MDLLLSSLLLFLSATLFVPAKSSTRPHIIVIVADDLGYNDVSFHGSDQIPTPNIDYLGYNGIILNNYYVSPICTPTRSALLTGRHPVHTGMQHSVIIGDQPYGLPLNETLMSQHLNALGYKSHVVGKWHLGMVSWDYTPLYRGFKSHLGYYQGCEDYYDHTYEATQSQWGLDFRKDKELMWNYTGKYSTEVFREEAVRIIKNHNKSEPLFLYLPFQAVHSSNGNGPHLQAPLEYIQKFSYIQNQQRRIYAAMLSALDDAVGEIHDTLQSTGLLANSVILFTTDNGGPANGFDFNAANNFPLRGVKATLWEGGVRGVGLVHSPLLNQSGYVADQMVHVCDWLPTLYRAAGGDASHLQNLDGYDMWDMLSNNGPQVRSEILHNIDPLENKGAIRVGDYKLLIGNIDQAWGGWYPPFKLHGDEQSLHYSNFTGDLLETKERHELRQKLDTSYRLFWHKDVKNRLRHLYSQQDSQAYSRSLRFETEGKHKVKDEVKGSLAGQRSMGGSPVKVECGEKPANASTNCDYFATFCLFNIKEDPCEYYNIAESNPDVVSHLLDRLGVWLSTMVKPANRPYDDRGNPKHHGGAWVPWL